MLPSRLWIIWSIGILPAGNLYSVDFTADVKKPEDVANILAYLKEVTK